MKDVHKRNSNLEEEFKQYFIASRNVKSGTAKQYANALNDNIHEYVQKSLGEQIDFFAIEDPERVRGILSELKKQDDWREMDDSGWVSCPLNRYIEFLTSRNKFVGAFEVEAVIDAIRTTGLIYDEKLIKRFAASLLTKPFVILSGLAGSGKTQLALAFAKALCKDASKQLCVVAVGADWTNREPLLGFPNALKPNEYVKPENGALDVIINAVNDNNNPYFLVLDEMNLSYVERYFADFLSSMESHQPISLWNTNDKNASVPSSVTLPDNLFVVGTINVDETTYMFSPKVLDRANVIEFKVSVEDMANYLCNKKPVSLSVKNPQVDLVSNAFMAEAREKDLSGKDQSINDTLLAFFKELKQVNTEFGYRAASEIFCFVKKAETIGLSAEEAVDAAIVQKLLPKLHGSRKRITPVLKKLWLLCCKKTSTTSLEEMYALDFNASEFKYPLAADKVLRMYNAAVDNGFTSFAEA